MSNISAWVLLNDGRARKSLHSGNNNADDDDK